MSEIETPICSCCGHVIAPDEYAVHFSCPNCGEVVIWRCQKCRLFGNQYKCPKCGFEGP
ncbi:MAG: zinc finger domain-containing protein [Candidatus Odinarchaeia archaeon]